MKLFPSFTFVSLLFSTSTALAAPSLAAPSLAAPSLAAPSLAASPTGIVFQADAGVAAGVYGTAASLDDQSVSTSGGLVGARVRLHLGYRPEPRTRYGLALSIGGATVTGGAVPATDFDALPELALTPSYRVQLTSIPELELEGSLGVAVSTLTGSQNGLPDNVYPFMSVYVGPHAAFLTYYRPSGPDAAFALHLGVAGGVGFASDTYLFSITPTAGVSLGF